MTETTLFMRIQNIKNGAQYTDGSFHYSLFFSPLLLLRSFPTECICSNTINVTFADCLLAFYLNGIQLWLAAAATNALAGGCDAQSRPAGSGPAPAGGEQGSRGAGDQTRRAGSRGPGAPEGAAGSSLRPRARDLCSQRSWETLLDREDTRVPGLSGSHTAHAVSG